MIIPPLPVEGQDRRRYIIPKLPVAHSPAAPPLPLAQSGGDNGRSLPSFSTYLDTARATQQPSSPYLPTQILEAILRQDTQMPANNSLTQCSVLLAAESTARDPSGGCWLDSASSAFERGESKSVGGGSKSVEGESERRQAKRRHRANRRSRRIEQQGGFGHPKLQDFACCSRPAHQSLPNIQVAPTPLRAFTEPQGSLSDLLYPFKSSKCFSHSSSSNILMPRSPRTRCHSDSGLRQRFVSFRLVHHQIKQLPGNA